MIWFLALFVVWNIFFPPKPDSPVSVVSQQLYSPRSAHACRVGGSPQKLLFPISPIILEQYRKKTSQSLCLKKQRQFRKEGFNRVMNVF